jgi:Zn-finger nucleic acid-binding protein
MKTHCPNCRTKLTHEAGVNGAVAHCPTCRSSFMQLPPLDDLRTIGKSLTPRERRTLGHALEQPLGVLLANSAPFQMNEDARAAAELLRLAIRSLLTPIDTPVQSEDAEQGPGSLEEIFGTKKGR